MVKHSNVAQKFSYVLLALSPCALIHKYLHVAGFGLDLSASFNVTVTVSAPQHVPTTDYRGIFHGMYRCVKLLVSPNTTVNHTTFTCIYGVFVVVVVIFLPFF